jgi:AraC family transcriptional regulator, transcriptional activator of pobA
MAPLIGIRHVEFLRAKYGRELLVDVGWIDDLPGFQKIVASGIAHRLGFHDIMLITEGTGEFWLDEARFPLRPGIVLFTAPGQVRRWRAARVAGLALFFQSEFLQTYFNDPLFIHRLTYFDSPATRHVLPLAVEEAARFRARFVEMGAEIARSQGDSHHLLRAMLYEVLIRLNRQYVRRYGGQGDTQSNSLVVRYRQLVESEATRHHRVDWYARSLGVTPGHLNAAVRRCLGAGAKAYLMNRLLIEAKRHLLGGEPAGRVGRAIGFVDPAYFGRFFRREAGMSPGALRQRAFGGSAE